MTPPSLLYVIKQLELAVRAQLEGLVRPAALTVKQYTALTVLERHPDMTSAELARYSFVTSQSMADMIAPLLSRELIDRRPDPADRRRLVLTLTAKGRRLLKTYEPKVAALEQDMVRSLSASQIDDLAHLLLACRRALRDDGHH
jgi:DNA-binding MarR family transcriptional regulator